MRLSPDRGCVIAVGLSITAVMVIATPVFVFCLLFRFGGPLQTNVNKA
jgi:hypothetical protein